MNKKQKWILTSLVVIAILLVSSDAYIFVLTGGHPIGKKSINGIMDSVGSVASVANNAKKIADSSLTVSSETISWFYTARKSDSTQINSDLAKAKKRIDQLAGGYKAEKTNAKEIEKLKSLFQVNMNYIAKRDSVGKDDLNKMMHRIDSIASAKNVNPSGASGNVTPNTNNKKKVTIPNDESGKGQSPPTTGKGKKEYKPKIKKQADYQNYNKSVVK